MSRIHVPEPAHSSISTSPGIPPVHQEMVCFVNWGQDSPPLGDVTWMLGEIAKTEMEAVSEADGEAQTPDHPFAAANRSARRSVFRVAFISCALLGAGLFRPFVLRCFRLHPHERGPPAFGLNQQQVFPFLAMVAPVLGN